MCYSQLRYLFKQYICGMFMVTICVKKDEKTENIKTSTSSIAIIIIIIIINTNNNNNNILHYICIIYALVTFIVIMCVLYECVNFEHCFGFVFVWFVFCLEIVV